MVLISGLPPASLRKLPPDAVAGQPHGLLIGDAIFIANVASPAARRVGAARRPGEPRRVRNAPAFVHAHLTEVLRIPLIADAAATSPCYLNRRRGVPARGPRR